MRRELLAGETPGRDCNRARTDCLPRDVVRVSPITSIAADELEPMFSAPGGERRAELIAIVMIVGKGPDSKTAETIVGEFQPRAALHVSREQCDHNLRILLQPCQQLLDPG